MEKEAYWTENGDEDFAEIGKYKLVVEQMDDFHFFYSVSYEDLSVHESWDDPGRTTSRVEARKKAIEQMEAYELKINY